MEAMTVKKTASRNTNLELFRIITMLLIIAHHYVVNSGLCSGGGQMPMLVNIASPKSVFLYLFGAWGKIGINCFLMITGYFMCKSRITAKKYFKLFFTVIFYNVLFSCLFWITGRSVFSEGTCFVAVSYQKYCHEFYRHIFGVFPVYPVFKCSCEQFDTETACISAFSHERCLCCDGNV